MKTESKELENGSPQYFRKDFPTSRSSHTMHNHDFNFSLTAVRFEAPMSHNELKEL
jgi:hypothetical protein